MPAALGCRRFGRAICTRVGVGLGSIALLLLAGMGWLSPAQQEARPEVPRSTGSGVTALPVPPSAEEMAALEALILSKDPSERLTRVEEFLQKYPDSLLRGRAYGAASEAYRMQNNFRKSVEYGEKALAVNPRDALVMIVIADALVEGANPVLTDYQEQLTRAEAYARKALEILPGLLAASQRQPEVTEEQHRWQLAYIEALPHGTLGLIHLRRHDFAAAEGELKLATEMNLMRPNGTDFLRLGIAHLRQGEWREARDAFRRSLELGGPSAVTAQQQLERIEKILEQQREAVPVSPE